MVSGGESIGAVMVLRSAGETQFTRVESDRARILVPPLAGAVGLSSLSDQLRSDNIAADVERTRLVQQPAHAARVRPARASTASTRTVVARS